MPTEIYLVKVGMTMTEGMVSEWYVADGASIKKGEMLYALETEKVNLDVDASASGTVKHLVEPGLNMKPGEVVGYIFAEGEEIPEDLGSMTIPRAAGKQVNGPANREVESANKSVNAPKMKGGRLVASPAARRLAGELGVILESLEGTGPNGRIVQADVVNAAENPGSSKRAPDPVTNKDIKASPLARRLAAEMDVDLSVVAGTGPRGRVTREDIESHAARLPSSVESESEDRLVPHTGMRRTIASRMHGSLMNAAQLTMDMTVNMDEAVKLRGQLVKEWQDEGIKLTYTDLVVFAAVRSLRDNALMNSRYQDDGNLLLTAINIGIAVALTEGLVVPVVKGAGKLTLKEVARESARLATAAREGSLGLDDYAEGTFTVSSLGMYGVDSFTPILNEPQSGILGVNRLFDGVIWEDDRPVKSRQMTLSLTWDHRVLDGAPAAEFLVSVKQYLEEPYRLLV